MPKLVDAREQRREIREAARRVFARRGVTGTGLVHVAEAVGMGRSSLYHYYPDKASLVRDLARDLLRDEEALFAEALGAPGSPLDRIDRLAASMAHVFEAWDAIGRVMLDLRLLDARQFRRFFRTARRDLGALIAEGQTAGEIDAALAPELAAAAIIGAIDGLLLQKLVDAGAFPQPEALSRTLRITIRKALQA
jgi:AcrR family transcriptional regulator